MARICPHCNMVMCEEEAHAGNCPVCARELPWSAPPPAAEAPPPSPPPAPPSLLFPLALGVGMVVLGIVLYRQLSPPEEESQPDVPQFASTEQQKPEEPPPPEKPPVEAKQPETPSPMKVAAPPESVPKAQRSLRVPLLADDAIKFDGDLSDWKDVRPITLRPVERGTATKKPVIVPKEQKAYLAYCRRGLLVAVDAVDTSGVLENTPRPPKKEWAFWDNDVLEVYLDTANTRPQQRGEPIAHQFFALPLGTPSDAGTGGYEALILFSKKGKQGWVIVPHLNSGANPMLRGGRQTPNGWTLELLIPTAALRQAEFKPGKVFGLELQLATGTSTYYTWACADPLVFIDMHPDFWGDAILAGADARLELLAGNQVRVTDLDRNTDPRRRETIDVSWRQRGQEERKLRLMETAADTGIFVGTLPRPGSVEVLVEYLDPLSGTGATDVPVRATFPAGKPR